MILTSKDGGNFKPHPEGIHPAVCVDVMDLGLCETNFQGVRKNVLKVKLTFETEEKQDDGTACTISKQFTQSLHQKAKLAEFLGKWRGKPITPGENIDLDKLLGACCTLVVSHVKSEANGNTYANIDAISKATKKITASGTYDGAAARKRYADWKAKQSGGLAPTTPPPPMAKSPGTPSKSPAQKAPVSQSPEPEFDPEVGF